MSSEAVLTREQRILTVAGMTLATFLAALDQTVVATAGPAMMRSLAIEPGLYTWLTTAYLVASTVLVPVYGRLSDLWGRKWVVLWGVGLFVLASMLCGGATSTGQLVAFRALQGAGSAAIFTTAFAVVADLFSPAERGRYSGLFGSVFAVSSLVGPLLGGFITDQWGWNWVFWVNGPVGLLAWVFIAWRMPVLKPKLDVRPELDVGGAVWLAIGVVPLLVALSLGRPEVRAGDLALTWADPRELGLLALAVVGLVGFVRRELKVAEPLVDLRLFEDATVKWGNATAFVMGAVFLTPMVFLPLFMVNVVGVSATASGLTVSPLVLGVVLGNLVSGQLVARWGRYKALMLVALMVLLSGVAVMAFTLTATSTQSELTLKMVLLGLGLGPSIPLYTIAIQNAVPGPRVGVATSMVTFFRQMGSSVGLALAGSLFATTLSTSLETQLAEATRDLPAELVERFRSSSPHDGPLDVATLKDRARGQLEGARSVARKALMGDPLATTLVTTSPLADERLKTIARAGGVRAQVQRSFASLRARVDAAAGSAQQWRELQQAADLPAELKAWLPSTSAAAMDDAVSRANLLTQAHQLVENGERQAEEKAVQQSMQALEQQFASLEPKLFRAIEQAGDATKAALTTATKKVFFVALWLAVVALALTLRLPRVTLPSDPKPD